MSGREINEAVLGLIIDSFREYRKKIGQESGAGGPGNFAEMVQRNSEILDRKALAIVEISDMLFSIKPGDAVVEPEFWQDMPVIYSTHYPKREVIRLLKARAAAQPPESGGNL